MRKFWMIFLEGGNSPKFQHGELASAQNEAARLKRLYPNNKVFILEAISLAQIVQPPIQHTPIDDLPF